MHYFKIHGLQRKLKILLNLEWLQFLRLKSERRNVGSAWLIRVEQGTFLSFWSTKSNPEKVRNFGHSNVLSVNGLKLFIILQIGRDYY